jgi:hypothetical protein
MKKLATLVFSFLLIGITAKATSVTLNNSEEIIYNRYDGNAYIFVEGGVEFSVFADGQFDFAYVGPNHGTEVTISSPNVNVSFNAGHDYEMFVQYDDYGAVIQVEDVPIYYDGYGRITQAGTVDIQYNDTRIVRLGGLYVNYDHYGYYAGCTGYINVYNRFYVYRPWHIFYVRPVFSSCIVYDYPYRAYYTPVRYSFHQHRDYYNNRSRVAYAHGRRNFYRPGSRVHYEGGRTAVNKDFNPNRRNTMAAESGRNNNVRSSREVAKTNSTTRPVTSRGTVEKSNRANSVSKGRPVTTGEIAKVERPRQSSSQGSTVNKRSSVENTKQRTSTPSRPSNNKVSQRSTSSKSNTSASRGGNSNSRDTTSRGGRG